MVLTDIATQWGDPGILMREQYAFQNSSQEQHVRAKLAHDLTGTFPSSAGAYVTLHYCHSHNFQEWGFHKALATDGWYADRFNNVIPTPIECGAPLLQSPPPQTSTDSNMILQ